MGGVVRKYEEVSNGLKITRSKWEQTSSIKAMAYDSLNAGYNTFNTVSTRLWKSLPMFGKDIKQIEQDTVNLLMKGANQGNEHDAYKNIMDIRKECERITCSPFPKNPEQSLGIQELVIK